MLGKLIVFFALIALSFQIDYHFFRFRGNIMINGAASEDFDNLMAIFVSKEYGSGSRIPGLYTKTGFIPFFFGYNLTKVVINGDKVDLSGNCFEAGWGMNWLGPKEGQVSIKGTWQKLDYSGDCVDPKTGNRFSVKATLVYDKCIYFNHAEGARRAQALVGKKTDIINESSQVPNFAYRGYPYFMVSKTCTHFLKEFGTNSTSIKPGYVVAGLDGQHCGMINSAGDMFIQYNAAQKEVTSHPVRMMKMFFPKGYQMKEPPCE